MWPFSRKPKPTTILEHPRYAKEPINLLFEALILDVIGHLPDAKRQALQAMNLQKVFNTRASEWRAVLRETLHLSDTIDVAILDLWYRNRDVARQQGQEYDPVSFSQDFADHYLVDDSKVDVWPGDALEVARKRIAEYRAAEANQNRGS